MYIESIELQNYRNYIGLSMFFDKGTNIIYGDNAQGKTNILEAVYLCGTTKSHRGSNASYTSDTPVKTDVEKPEDYEFIGWNPSPNGITGNTDCYAQYRFIGYISVGIVERSILSAKRNLSGLYI